MIEIIKKFFFLPGIDNNVSACTIDIPIKNDNIGPISFAYVVHSIFDEDQYMPNNIINSDTKKRGDFCA